MRTIVLYTILVISCNSCFAQERILKAEQPGIVQLSLTMIPLHPNDTNLSYKDFEHLPVKFFPYFIIDSNQKFYSTEERDSIIGRIELMFYDVVTPSENERSFNMKIDN